MAKKVKEMQYLLNEEKPAGNVLIVLGYVLAFLGGMIGLFIGNHILTSWVSASGEEFYKFDERSRLHARNIIILAVAVIVFGLFFNLGLKI
jgi:hypothetical protein